MITEDYVSFEVAKLLKDKGFNWQVRNYYCLENNEYIQRTTYEYNYVNLGMPRFENCIACPTLQMAMKWLREIHKINIDIKSHWKLNPYKLDYYYFVLHYKNVPSDSFIIKFDSYEKAVEAALKYCLENLV